MHLIDNENYNHAKHYYILHHFLPTETTTTTYFSTLHRTQLYLKNDQPKQYFVELSFHLQHNLSVHLYSSH
jgi:hypothetical protein